MSFAQIKKALRYSPYGGKPFPLFVNRLAKIYADDLALLAQADSWTDRQYEQWLITRLSETADYAFSHVPYYSASYKKVGYTLGCIRSLSDFTSLPLISKDTIKQSPDAFLSVELSNISHYAAFTGGSTDKPMRFVQDQATGARGGASLFWYWKHYGYMRGRDRCVVLRGHHSADIKKKRLFDYDRVFNYKRFDSAYVTDMQYLPLYKKQMEDFGARVMQAYPSSAYNLAKSFEAAGIEPPRFDLILLGSENNYPDQITCIKSAYRAKRVMYHYGLSEAVSLALKYPDSDCLGFMQTYGYSELVADNGNSALTAGETGQIVGTSYNRAMPLIRYQTGDYAMKSDYRSSDWMRHYPSIERIEGRKHEFVVTKDLRLVSLCIIAGAHMQSLSLIGEMQYYQDTPGVLRILVTGISGEPVNQKTLRAVAHDYQVLFKDDMEIVVEAVERLKRTQMNKRIIIVQKLDLQQYRNVSR